MGTISRIEEVEARLFEDDSAIGATFERLGMLSEETDTALSNIRCTVAGRSTDHDKAIEAWRDIINMRISDMERDVRQLASQVVMARDSIILYRTFAEEAVDWWKAMPDLEKLMHPTAAQSKKDDGPEPDHKDDPAF